jgi:hypothetical protein
MRRLRAVFRGSRTFHEAEAPKGGATIAQKPFGDVISAAIVTDRDTGHSRGFGFVEMTSIENAERAVADLNGRELDGRSLKVELGKPKVRSYAN